MRYSNSTENGVPLKKNMRLSWAVWQGSIMRRRRSGPDLWAWERCLRWPPGLWKGTSQIPYVYGLMVTGCLQRFPDNVDHSTLDVRETSVGAWTIFDRACTTDLRTSQEYRCTVWRVAEESCRLCSQAGEGKRCKLRYESTNSLKS